RESVGNAARPLLALNVSSLLPQSFSGVGGRPDSPRHCENGAHDPIVWSGRASQEVFIDLSACGLASMYPASDWSGLCSGPSWISARLRSHYRTGLERAIWVTRVRRRRGPAWLLSGLNCWH